MEKGDAVITPVTQENAVDVVARSARELTGSAGDYDALMDQIASAPFVLLGEATHGTTEFYRARAEITKRLIIEKGFTAVAVEADWPDAYRINRYVRWQGGDENAIDALGDFERFPRWMWRNAEVLEFVGWLRDHNEGLPPERRVGFYGLDLYSLYSSIAAVVEYLDRVDPKDAERARARYACLDHQSQDEHDYGHGVALGLRRSCEDEVVEQLVDLRHRAMDYLRRDGVLLEDEQFYAEQNARVVRNAEEYYRSMFGRRVSSWNLRDRHMVDTLGALAQHLSRRGRSARVAVWEHNSHIGNAGATEMSARGETNVGEMVRRRYGDAAILVGFTTYTGTVSAASDWGAHVERKHVRPALPESYESLMHSTGIPAFFLSLRDSEVIHALREPRLERAIGVIYRPDTERVSHYFHSRLPDQFDALLHFDETRALEPIDRTDAWVRGEMPETYPFGV